MQVLILGPLEVRDGDAVVEIDGYRVRRLLLRLALDVGRPVSTDQLADAVWDGEPPANQANALQTLVSRVRRALGAADRVQRGAGGYSLVGVRTDTQEFTDLLASARTAESRGDQGAVVEELDRALTLWRGAALADAADAEFALAEAARWDELRLTARHDRLRALVNLGRAADVVVEAAQLTAEFGLREQFTELLMTALSTLGRTSEALEAYERLRVRLADELGTDPGPELQRQHLQLLRGTTADSARRGTRTNLRAGVTSFVGRDVERDRVSALLETGRLVTVVGPGGAGKTRLAGVAAAGWVDRLTDGVWLVELASVTDEANIAQAVLGSLGVRATQAMDRAIERLATEDRLTQVLTDSDCLLVMDNCEHLIAGVAQLLDGLLARCPRLRVLATSREPLGIDGESLCVLAPLALPPAGSSAPDAIAFPVVQLFAERAAAITAGFVVDADSVGSVVEIVRRLDGLPLAIELAAARLRVLPVAEIAARLHDRFRLLTGGSRVALPRHRTLRAVVEWSWELLSDHERLLVERLAVFPSGARTDAAVAICSDDALPGGAVAELLDALVEKSLLTVPPGDALRYRMLETIREYGIERLAERGELAAVRRRHAEWFADVVERAAPLLRTADQLHWLRLLEVERDNTVSAVRYLAEIGATDAAAANTALRMGSSLGWYWTVIGNDAEAASVLRMVLRNDLADDATGRLIGEALFGLSSLSSSLNGYPLEAEASAWNLSELGERLIAVDDDADPSILLLRPMMFFFGDESSRAESLLQYAVDRGDRWIRASALMFRARYAENNGDIAGMRADATEAVELFTEIGDRWGLANAMSALAIVHTFDGDLAVAIEMYQRAAAHMALFGAAEDQTMMHLRLVDLQLRAGDLAAARAEAARIRTNDFQGGSRIGRILAETAFLSIALAAEEADSIEQHRARLAGLLDSLDLQHPIGGHALALGLTMLATLSIRAGELTAAESQLRLAHSSAVGAEDMPLLAGVGVAVASLRHARGDHAGAARTLGASARIRGADDPTDTIVCRLSAELRAVPDAGFDESYAAGRCLERPAALAAINPEVAGSPRGERETPPAPAATGPSEKAQALRR